MAWGQPAGLRDAVVAMQRGDFQAAELRLRQEAQAHPDDAATLSLLGAALDSQNKFSEAGRLHRLAVAKVPRGTDVLNNYAAHLWLTGDYAGSRKLYLQVVAIDPAQFNANVQLARMALKQKNPAEALRYLRQDHPQMLLLRLEAQYMKGDQAQADVVMARLTEMAGNDSDLSFAAGVTLSSAKQFDSAGTFFEMALKADPANFSVLFNLGVVAVSAGRYERAREVLETALRQQPRNVDVLYSLARAEEALKNRERAVQLLAQAAKLDPSRADVQKMIALTTTELDALDDAAAAWERYLKLVPNDDVARRERGYTAAKMGRLEQGIADLEWFLARHPGDAPGHFELGQAERSLDVAKALGQFDKALALDPGYVEALAARGSLYYQSGKPEAAVRDLELAVKLRPADAAGLDRLGQTYQALDRTSDAVHVLRRSAELAPGDSKTLLHFARALAVAGNTDESKAVMDRFRQLGPEKRTAVPVGFVDYLSLTPEQRNADYRARLEKVLLDHPDDAGARLAWLKLSLVDADWKRAALAARDLIAMKPGAALLADAGHALLAAQQYGPAMEVLTLAGAGGEVDLAVAVFRGGDRVKGWALLDGMGADRRDGTYLLSRAAMLEALDKPEQALAVYGEVARAHPDDRSILLMKAVATELAGQGRDAEQLLDEVRNRWPEWYPVWLAQGTILRLHGRADEAKRAVDTAALLGAPGAEFSLRDFLDGRVQ